MPTPHHCCPKKTPTGWPCSSNGEQLNLEDSKDMVTSPCQTPMRMLMEGNVFSRLEGTQHQMGQCRGTCQTQEKLDSTCCWIHYLTWIRKEREIQMSKALFNICNVTLLMTLMGCRCRLHNSGWVRQNVPFTWERRSNLCRINEVAADRSCTIPGNHDWFCRSGATRRTEHLSYLNWLMTWGSTAIKGKAYRCTLGHSWASMSCSFEKNIGQWDLSSEVKKSTSTFPKTLQII